MSKNYRLFDNIRHKTTFSFFSEETFHSFKKNIPRLVEYSDY